MKLFPKLGRTIHTQIGLIRLFSRQQLTDSIHWIVHVRDSKCVKNQEISELECVCVQQKLSEVTFKSNYNIALLPKKVTVLVTF